MNICKALLKYDYVKFSRRSQAEPPPPIEILEYCEPSELLEKENHYFKLLKPEYNICQEAGNRLGLKHSDGRKAKISVSRLAQKLSDGIKAKMSAARL
jgi:group I intron endonuclease